MSDTPDHTSDLPRTQAASEDPVARLSALWRHGQKPDLQEFLAGAGQLSAAELTDVLCTDQHERWMDGQRPAVEAYFELHGSFHPGSALPIELILGEFLARRELGESATPDEYCQRFPELAEQLRLHIHLYDALGDVVSATDDTAIGPGVDPSTVSRSARAPSSGNERQEASALRGPEAGAWDSDYESFKRLLQDMAGEQSAATLLPLIVRRLVGRPNVALARIWLVRPGNLCATCPVRRSARIRRPACTLSPAPADRSTRRAIGRGSTGVTGASPSGCARLG